MKYVLMLLLGVVLLLPACSTNLDVNAPYQEEMVVFGLFNYKDAVQYVRIEKGYLDKTKSALTLAQIPDSIYYSDSILKVQLIRQSDNFTYTLTKSTNVVPKDSGTFAFASNILYTFNGTIDPAQTYQLVVTNTHNGKVVTAQTSIVNTFNITRPQDIAGQALDLAGYNNDGTPKTFSVQWNSPINGKDYSVVLRFHYTEWDINSPSIIDTLYTDWLVADGVTSNGTSGGEALSANLVGNQFYAYLASALKQNANKRRAPLATPVEFRITAGGEELYNYISVNQVQSGITQLQAQTKYTNINGGLGIFSSRTTVNRTGIGLNGLSLDSLACGSVTKNLNFKISGTPCF